MSKRTVIIFRDDKPVSEEMPDSQWFPWLQQNQGMSVDYALQHGGYRVRYKGEFAAICLTPDCLGTASAVSLWEQPSDQYHYRCDECLARIAELMPEWNDDGTMTRANYDALVKSVLAMNVTELRGQPDVPPGLDPSSEEWRQFESGATADSPGSVDNEDERYWDQ